MHHDDTWAELGKRLVARGLNERALRHCFGVTCAIHAPLRALAAEPAVLITLPHNFRDTLPGVPVPDDEDTPV